MSVYIHYRHTTAACYISYCVQAIVNNFAPLLFLTFQLDYDISLSAISLLITLNFGIQLLTDLFSAKFVDKIGYRVSIVAAHIFAAAGLLGLGILPGILPAPYLGLCIAVVLYAIGGGLIEVLVSPIVEACPNERKAAAMSLLHSFYCWGSVLVISLSTAFFAICGTQHWRILSGIWAIVPLFNSFYFARVPLLPLVEDGTGMTISALLKSKSFWIFALLMLCAGAAEQSMSQWASAFAESGLGVSKTIGDLAGPCGFAILMGLARVLQARISTKVSLTKFLSICGVLCVCSYLLASLSESAGLALTGCVLCGFSVGAMWPGVFSLSSQKCPKGGMALIALLALAGDCGCSAGPTWVGVVSSTFGEQLKTGLLAAILFPLLLLFGLRAAAKDQTRE